MIPRAFHQSFRAGVAVLLQQALFQAAGIDTDADGDVSRTACVSHSLYMLFSPDVARVDADLVDSAFSCHKSQFIVEVDICHEGHICPIADSGESFCRLHIGHCQTHDIAPGCLKCTDLLQCCLHIPGFRVAHALHGNGSISADFQAADGNLPRLISLIHLLQSSLYHSEIQKPSAPAAGPCPHRGHIPHTWDPASCV